MLSRSLKVLDRPKKWKSPCGTRVSPSFPRLRNSQITFKPMQTIFISHFLRTARKQRTRSSRYFSPPVRCCRCQSRSLDGSLPQISISVSARPSKQYCHHREASENAGTRRNNTNPKWPNTSWFSHTHRGFQGARGTSLRCTTVFSTK